jgi:hypothetical protein
MKFARIGRVLNRPWGGGGKIMYLRRGRHAAVSSVALSAVY